MSFASELARLAALNVIHSGAINDYGTWTDENGVPSPTLKQAIADIFTNGRVFAAGSEGVSNGVRGIANLAGGTLGANGTFNLAFSGGGGSGAAGRFTVALGTVTSVLITSFGKNYTSAPTISFAASSGLTGASVTAVIASLTGDGEYYGVVAPGTDYMQLWRNVAGAATGPIKTLPGITTLGVLQTAKNKKMDGRVEMVRDVNGKLRVISQSALAGVPTYYGKVPETLGVKKVSVTKFLCDPERTECVRDVNGKLRVLSSIGKKLVGFGSGSESLTAKTPTEFVVFLVAGQSNALGIGNKALAPAVAPGVAYKWYSGTLTPITADPVGGANTGSAWPAFINEFYRRTGLGVIIVPTAVGGAALVAGAGSPNWSGTGTLRGTAIAALNAGLTAIAAAGYAWRFGGVLWSQGEADGRAVFNGVITVGNYNTEFDNLLSYFRTQTGSPDMPFVMSQTGGDTTGAEAAGLKDIRDAQRALVKTRDCVYFGWTGAFNLIARGLMRDRDFPTDDINLNRSHYSQQGYNEMGAAMAVVASTVSIGVA